eukprot:TRINITY_DN11427_c0_g1_i3.p1 TRINITY_DN11427_c0_g1~~TRINITY_DN11427_c0_g1_i3.p1  ORF type:complete len:962 (-),score=201.73 TRINITY_DN11427_c0_g1_i3:9-2894(-)
MTTAACLVYLIAAMTWFIYGDNKTDRASCTLQAALSQFSDISAMIWHGIATVHVCLDRSYSRAWVTAHTQTLLRCYYACAILIPLALTALPPFFGVKYGLLEAWCWIESPAVMRIYLGYSVGLVVLSVMIIMVVVTWAKWDQGVGVQLHRTKSTNPFSALADLLAEMTQIPTERADPLQSTSARLLLPSDHVDMDLLLLLLFSFIFFVLWLPNFISRILDVSLDSVSVFSRADVVFIQSITFPIQGCMGMVVYMRCKRLRMRWRAVLTHPPSLSPSSAASTNDSSPFAQPVQPSFSEFVAAGPQFSVPLAWLDLFCLCCLISIFPLMFVFTVSTIVISSIFLLLVLAALSLVRLFRAMTSEVSSPAFVVASSSSSSSPLHSLFAWLTDTCCPCLSLSPARPSDAGYSPALAASSARWNSAPFSAASHPSHPPSQWWWAQLVLYEVAAALAVVSATEFFVAPDDFDLLEPLVPIVFLLVISFNLLFQTFYTYYYSYSLKRRQHIHDVARFSLSRKPELPHFDPLRGHATLWDSFWDSSSDVFPTINSLYVEILKQTRRRLSISEEGLVKMIEHIYVWSSFSDDNPVLHHWPTHTEDGETASHDVFRVWFRLMLCFVHTFVPLTLLVLEGKKTFSEVAGVDVILQMSSFLAFFFVVSFAGIGVKAQLRHFRLTAAVLATKSLTTDFVTLSAPTPDLSTPRYGSQRLALKAALTGSSLAASSPSVASAAATSSTPLLPHRDTTITPASTLTPNPTNASTGLHSSLVRVGNTAVPLLLQPASLVAKTRDPGLSGMFTQLPAHTLDISSVKGLKAYFWLRRCLSPQWGFEDALGHALLSDLIEISLLIGVVIDALLVWANVGGYVTIVDAFVMLVYLYLYLAFKVGSAWQIAEDNVILRSVIERQGSEWRAADKELILAEMARDECVWLRLRSKAVSWWVPVAVCSVIVLTFVSGSVFQIVNHHDF